MTIRVTLALLTSAALALTGLLPAAVTAAPATPRPYALTRLSAAHGSAIAGQDSGAPPIGTDPRALPTIPVGGNPVDVAVDDPTHTAYITNGNDATVSVVDTTHCRAHDTSGCGQMWPTVAVGNGPVNLAVNQRTHTVYVTNIGDNTVSVIDGATCNAGNHTGCGQTTATIPVGTNPDYVGIDESTNTVYVVNDNFSGPGSVSAINGNLCDATSTIGCSQIPPAISVGDNPIGLALDPTNHTAYVANCGVGPINGCASTGSVSMVNMSTCNAVATAGCGQVPPTVGVAGSAAWVDVDRSTNTVYVSAFGPSLGTVSVIDSSDCNAMVTSGCGKPQPTVTAGSGPIGIVVDQQTHGVFVANQEDASFSVIDGLTCNARVSVGCAFSPPDVGVGFSAGTPGIDPATQTLYVPSQDLNSVTVIPAGSCTLFHHAGCRQASPTAMVGNAPQGIFADPVTGTVYVANRSDNTLSLINGNACDASHLSGCTASRPTVPTGNTPQFITIDQATRTGYIANLDGSVSAFDAAHCNAAVQSACQMHTITVSTSSHYLDWMAVDDANHTLYVTDYDADGVALIDMSTCNAANFSGCGQTPGLASTGAASHPDGVALDLASQSLYVADGEQNTISVIDAATCNVQVSLGCSGPHPTVTVDSRPTRIAIDQGTNTIFAASRDTDRVAVIDGSTCNALHPAGCSTPVATIPISRPTGDVRHPITITVDEDANLVYLTDVVDSDIVVLNGVTCNGRIISGCSRPIGDLIRTGGWPSGVTLDPALGTGYNPDNVDGQASIFRLLRPPL
jgi:DNA-binding beta-propeller fold protein YncE